MFITYNEYDRAEGYGQPSLAQQVKQEQEARDTAERARLARNAARDAEQATWPMPPCRWVVLADRLVHL